MAALASSVGINVDLVVARHLVLDGHGVDVLLFDKLTVDVGMLGCRRRAAACDLDVNRASVALILGNGSHGEAVGVLLAAHECAGPRVQAICGRLEVDVAGIQVRPVPVPVDCVDGPGFEVAGQLDS